MPSRVIRDGWVESERIDQLDVHGERFYLRLCLRADDYGRYHANPALLKSNLFPLKDDVRSADIPRWLAACEKAGLVRCYEVAGKRYVEIQRFDQRMRAKVSKFPPPPADDSHVPVMCPPSASTPPPESEADLETKEETSSPCPKSASPPPDEARKFVDWFLALLAETGAPTPKITPSVRENWADCYDKMLRLDGRTKEQVKAVCRWARNDPFWRRNFLSPMKLREKKDGVPWFDQFAAKLSDDAAPKRPPPAPDIYTEPADWRQRAAAKWPDMQMPERWDDLSSTLRNDLLGAKR